MKKVLIGGFVSLIGSIWAMAIVFSAVGNLTDQWYTPPGRFLTTISEQYLMVPFVLAVVCVIVGLAIMAIEYFRKEK